MKNLTLQFPASDLLSWDFAVDQNGTLIQSRLTGIGGPDLLRLLQHWRGKLQGPIALIALPQGTSGPELMLRELLLKARGEWIEPYAENELCHCRAVATEVVHHAIVAGAHCPEDVSRWTSASTACGTCRKDVLKLLESQGFKR